MISTQNQYSDQAIVSMLKSGELLGWNILYDKYSSILFGAILKVTSEEKLAKEILIESFINLQKSDILIHTKRSLLIFLLHYTYTFSASYLYERGITPLNFKTASHTFPLINLLLFTTLPHQKIAKTIGIHETELKTKLLSESQNLSCKMLK